MFSTARMAPVLASRAATPSANSRAYSRCQRNGGCRTTVLVPTAWARSIERSIFSQGSFVPHTRWDTNRVGAWMDRMGVLYLSAREVSVSGFCVAGSPSTITSTPSYPVRAAISNPSWSFFG